MVLIQIGISNSNLVCNLTIENVWEEKEIKVIALFEQLVNLAENHIDIGKQSQIQLVS